MDSTRVIGSMAITLLIILGFLIHDERGNEMEVRQAVVHLLEASDEIQELAFNNVIDMDYSIKVREDIKKVIEDLHEARNQ